MNFNQLPSVQKDDDLLIMLEQFKNGLISRATGKGYEESEYQKIRKIILANSQLAKLAPKFLKICRTTDEFWEWIKIESTTYSGRKDAIGKLLNPLLDYVEYETEAGALEFSKNYEEKEVIGSGGFGVVYRYEHRILKMSFAVKVFSPSFYEGPTEQKELERFFQESRMLFMMQHPNIIRIYDAGLIGKRPFIRMEFFDGLNLNKFMEQYGLFSEVDALLAMKHITSGIEHAHNKGIIHRDLKPSNVMATQAYDFRVIDFGLGIFVENELHSRLTKTGVQSINGYYNAPELIAHPKLIDKRSDIYSLGAIWYTLLTGHPPAGSDFKTPLQLVSVSEPTIDVVIKCLLPLETRYTDCKTLLNDLETL